MFKIHTFYIISIVFYIKFEILMENVLIVYESTLTLHFEREKMAICVCVERASFYIHEYQAWVSCLN
jgi:hypothetical protein